MRIMKKPDRTLPEKDELYEKFKGLVLQLANKYRHIGTVIEFGDLVQMGFEGLIKSHNTYNPKGGASFATYAHQGITFEIRNGISKVIGKKDSPRRLNKVVPLEEEVEGIDSYYTTKKENLVDSKASHDPTEEMNEKIDCNIILAKFRNPVLKKVLEKTFVGFKGTEASKLIGKCRGYHGQSIRDLRIIKDDLWEKEII